MKLHFEPNLGYQNRAVAAVRGLFRGQEVRRTGLSATNEARSLAGIGNRLALTDEDILANLRNVQRRNGLRPSAMLRSGHFTVEMETGTGKTYVYLRTIFELNKHYGFSKFLIVVPSIAIKEGVYKTLNITRDHFKSLYAGTPFEYFLYDSKKMGQVRNFATSPHIQIMVVTVGAINKKDVNNLYKDSETMGGESPIGLIRETRPIQIVDEPQSVDGGLNGRGKEALEAMKPLCTLRYSATHVDEHHMVYRLDAVDAYEQELVKQVEVASASVENAHNRPYVRLLSVANRRGAITARVELDVETARGIRRKACTVRDGDLLERTTNREIYRNCRIGEIRVEEGGEVMELRVSGGEHFLKPGEARGSVDVDAMHRQMIHRTIREHLDKEKRLRPRGIKVLSLFFIDAVNRYRRYDENGAAEKGPLAGIFEEEYRRLMNHPDYRTLFGDGGPSRDPSEVHDGYFSLDRKGGWSDTAENNRKNRENAERAYTLIMKDKEKLLDLGTPLAFIFSHSALKEGWDNPNVFQICALRSVGTERERRQTIGRGLRLCVNQEGERVRDVAVNRLTVVAAEGYRQFAEKLQREIEEETGIRPAGRLRIENADERRSVFPREAVPNSAGAAVPGGEAIFRMDLDNAALIERCIRAIRTMPPVPRVRLQWRKADLAIGSAGVEATHRGGSTTADLDDVGVDLPDVLNDLQDRTAFTRRTIGRILVDSQRLDDFRRNPRHFIEQVAGQINREKRLTLMG